MSHRTVYLETFGCQMNELDSELVAGQLRALGYRFTPDPDAADVVLYNTCSVREHAEQKVWSRLGELQLRKKGQPGLVVGVLGCMAERDGVDLVKRMPVVDVLCGPGELDKLPGLLDNAVRTRASLLGDDPRWGDPAHRSAAEIALQGSTSRRSATLAAAEDSLELLDLSRAISPIDPTGADGRPGPRASAYVRITRGCNKFCTYCVVPFTRGAEIHRPPDHIIDECRKLADAGVIEITLLGQTVNHYRFEHGAAVTMNGIVQPQKGRSYSGGHRRDPFHGQNTTTFADLLARIHDEVPAIQRLRFVTSYPRDFGDDVLEVMREHPRICRYLHVPAQSGSNRILKAMNRGYSIEEYFDFLDRARAHLDQPEINRPLMVSGDIIVGFPTETEEDFRSTIELVTRARYKNCFIFKYSPRPGTIAYDRMADDVLEADKRRRNNHLLAVQAAISDQISREQVGRRASIFVEGVSRREQKKAVRKSAACGSGAGGGGGAAAGGVSLTIGGRTVDEPQGACSTGAPAALLSPAEMQEDPARLVQYSGRTDTDLIVFFEAPAAAADSLIGTLVEATISSADGLALHASLA
jgi:tRNA-2-methylthio-N6-dimethylallyladenosine synthase